MATRYRFGYNYIPHFVTFSVVQWVDALSRPHYKDIIVESLKYCIAGKNLVVHAWVIMNNHVHLIISAKENTKLEDIIRDLKKFTSKRLVEAINDPHESRRSWMLWIFSAAGERNSNNTIYQFWQQDNHPIALENSEIAKQKLNYIHDNPIRAGIVSSPEYYIYSSAVDYYLNREGLVPLELLV